jgi:hypothetical protein
MFKRAFVAVIIPAALVLGACSPGATDADVTAVPASPSVSASATPSATESASESPTTAATSYSESDKKNFLDAIVVETDEVYMESDEDLVDLADTIIAAHGRGVAWDDVVKVLKENFTDSDAEIYGELVVIHLMKDLPKDDGWKVAASAERQTREAAKAPEPEPEETEPEMTVAQEQAVGKAEDYLDGQHFSKKGLIEQLRYEGFSKKNAEFAVEHIDVSWKKQAAGKAEDYLNGQHFSRSGLIAQLKYEGFTQSQAEYGVKKAGL